MHYFECKGSNFFKYSVSNNQVKFQLPAYTGSSDELASRNIDLQFFSHTPCKCKTARSTSSIRILLK